ncbi:CopG family ribbon-helix-helix protein [Methanothermobacter wolfeii]|uniref:CopG family ribbon-helix-helix protein n=1 Tax=Methanothermobacter wolfeii TaxID=145261 RepID=UPI0024B36930|nr:CopG family ribbon-helix-helix protein [Methanothermobacter wolfeii]MDI6701455.1 CopG family ribbon-helix-helix protein [Methanothermobacter wolfeii]MDI6842619.1 CopG family ribbon-helix-helix protein [Methanothermobacter wolfeii]
MVVVSVSIGEKLLEEIDRIRDDMGFSGRSDVIRTAARMFIDEKKNLDELSGDINAVIFLIHHKRVEDRVNNIKHDYEDIINTQVHSHLRDGNCLEIFILEGDAERITELSDRFHGCGMKHIKLITV